MGYIQMLAEIATKELGDEHLYCISDEHDDIIAGDAACECYIRPVKTGGWRVILQEFGRGTIYEDYHLATEREACIKFIEMTEDYYHFGKYLGEFAEEKDGLPKEYTHIYCSVAFEDDGQTWYHRTNDETLAVGDYVAVPWGVNNRRRFGRIEKVEQFPEDSVPFPLNRTKFILSRAEEKDFITQSKSNLTHEFHKIMMEFEQRQRQLIVDFEQEFQRILKKVSYDKTEYLEYTKGSKHGNAVRDIMNGKITI